MLISNITKEMFLYMCPRYLHPVLKDSQRRCINLSAVVSKIIIDKSKFPTLDEKDIEEKFIRGSGPGGQSVNKTSSACFIRHIPTDIIVKSHEFRSLKDNRKRARELLLRKLDHLYNEEMSIEAQKKRIEEKKSKSSQQKARKRNLLKQEWRENQDLT